MRKPKLSTVRYSIASAKLGSSTGWRRYTHTAAWRRAGTRGGGLEPPDTAGGSLLLLGDASAPGCWAGGAASALHARQANQPQPLVTGLL